MTTSPLLLYTPPVLARVQSYLLSGIDALPCEVEVDFDNTSTDTRELIVGLPDAGVKEALQRVRAALANTGYTTGNGRLLVNLAPADLRKEGPVYDLPIALGLLISAGARPSPCPGPFRSADRSRQGSLDAEPFGRLIASLTLLLGRLCDRDPDAARFVAALAGGGGGRGRPRRRSAQRPPSAPAAPTTDQGVVVVLDLGNGRAALMCEPTINNTCGTRGTSPHLVQGAPRETGATVRADTTEKHRARFR